jgi:hypothetical protein
MVRTLSHACLVAVITACPLIAQYQMRHPNEYYISENWPTYSLKLTRDGALAELFEAGLRPGYTSMAKNSQLDLKHARVTFILANGRPLPEFAAEYGRVSVTRSGLSRLSLVSQPLSVVEAKATMGVWLPFFSEKRYKTEAQLDDFLRKVAADYSGYDDRNFGAAPEGFGGGWKDENGVGYGVRFQKAYNETLPVRIYLDVVWHYVRTDKEERAFYREPIPSPKGHEIPTLENWGPDSTSEMMYAKGIPFPDGYGLSGIGKNDVVEVSESEKVLPKIQPNRKSGKSAAEEEPLLPDEKQNHLLWIIGGVLLLGVVVILVRALRRGRAS